MSLTPSTKIGGSISSRALTTIVCLSGTLLGSMFWGIKWWRKNLENKSQIKEKTKKLGWGGSVPDSTEVDLAAVHEFYEAVQACHLLYPYFMNVKAENREKTMQKIACSFHKTLQKQHTPADSIRLKAIHKDLNIKEDVYNRFTYLFAHICCRGKSDELRARMLKTFAMLKSEICLSSSEQPCDIASFFEMLHSNPQYSYPQREAGESGTPVAEYLSKNVQDSVWFPRECPRTMVLERAKAWNNRSTHGQLLKKITELEKNISSLTDLNCKLNMRIQAMESSG